jgi:putative Mg2+ transporter-C (MgtC) family protein
MAFLHTFFALTVAFVLGTGIGFERQWRQRNAGLRTVVLVATGAAAFVELGMRLNGNPGAVSIIAYVVSGIGFLGAGVILKDGASIRGLNTAATIWASAAVGAFSGAGLPLEAAAVTAFILAGNTLLRPLVDWVNRRPFRDGETESLYRVHATCLPANISDVRDLLEAVLTRLHYPILGIEMESESENQVELAATLVPTTADAAELDQAVAALEESSLVRSATWTVGTTL